MKQKTKDTIKPIAILAFIILGFIFVSIESSSAEVFEPVTASSSNLRCYNQGSGNSCMQLFKTSGETWYVEVVNVYAKALSNVCSLSGTAIRENPSGLSQYDAGTIVASSTNTNGTGETTSYVILTQYFNSSTAVLSPNTYYALEFHSPDPNDFGCDFAGEDTQDLYLDGKFLGNSASSTPASWENKDMWLRITTSNEISFETEENSYIEFQTPQLANASTVENAYFFSSSTYAYEIATKYLYSTFDTTGTPELAVRIFPYEPEDYFEKTWSDDYNAVINSSTTFRVTYPVHTASSTYQIQVSLRDIYKNASGSLVTNTLDSVTAYVHFAGVSDSYGTGDAIECDFEGNFVSDVLCGIERLQQQVAERSASGFNTAQNTLKKVFPFSLADTMNGIIDRAEASTTDAMVRIPFIDGTTKTLFDSSTLDFMENEWGFDHKRFFTMLAYVITFGFFSLIIIVEIRNLTRDNSDSL